MNKQSIVLVFVFALILLSSQAQANIRGKESLLFQKIPSVITASREVVTVLESPATATIISRQDIVHSGYNSVSELLRFVAGVDFFQTGDAGFSIGMRGVNGLHSNNVLILVDGRPIYSPVRNTNQCALIPEVPDDIERIEVIKGPGSVLYGSNAFSGVINIITRMPEAIHGVQLTASPGTFSDHLYSLTSGDRFGRWSCKLVSAWTQKNSTAEHDRQVKGLWKMSGELNFESRPDSNYNLSFGFSKGKLLVASAIPLMPFDQDGFDGFLRSRFNWNDRKLDIWWRHFDTSGDAVSSDHLRWKFDSRVDVFAGLRVDYQTEAHQALAPRLSIVYSLKDNQSLRFSASRSFKYPSYLQNYIKLGSGVFHHTGNIPPELFQEIHLQIHSHHGRITDPDAPVQQPVKSNRKGVILLPEKFPHLLIASASVIESKPVNKEALILDSHGKKGRKMVLGTVVVGMSLERANRDIRTK